MKQIILIVLLGTFVSMSGCKCGRDSEEAMPTENAEMPNDAQHNNGNDLGGSQPDMGEQTVSPDMNQAPSDEGVPPADPSTSDSTTESQE